MDTFFNGLDSRQLEALEASESRILVAAGQGSGKTKTTYFNEKHSIVKKSVDTFFNGLDSRQLEALEASESRILVAAGQGSGKTKPLTLMKSTR